MRVVSDSVMNELTYYYVTGGVFEGIVEGYYADSAGKIIMWQDGYPYARSNKADDTLSYNLVGTDTIIQRTGNVDTIINVTAGAYNNTIQVIADIYYAGETVRLGHQYLYFGKGVGVVYGTFFFPNRPTQVVTMHLVGHHIAS